ncbi:unnamed protein product [Arabis nemorensis]|uniref:Uncharacterized protein n=1 Tax=Arabis nemorensis TaxID=586526 RepID=A0A565CC00_9BRAS|nr:unnamed protein product [Arabis nemorensis]
MSKFPRYLKNSDPLIAEYMAKQDDQVNSPNEAQGTAGEEDPGSTPLDPQSTT